MCRQSRTPRSPILVSRLATSWILLVNFVATCRHLGHFCGVGKLLVNCEFSPLFCHRVRGVGSKLPITCQQLANDLPTTCQQLTTPKSILATSTRFNLKTFQQLSNNFPTHSWQLLGNFLANSLATMSELSSNMTYQLLTLDTSWQLLEYFLKSLVKLSKNTCWQL